MSIVRSARTLLALGLLALLGLSLGFGLHSRPARAQEPVPRPTLEPTPTPTATTIPSPTTAPARDEPAAPTPIPAGRIIGTVIDLTTGAPAPGIAVVVGDTTVTSDANGNYERGSLPAGDYLVALALSPQQGTPAQQPITIALAADATVVQHLAFRSQPTPSPTLAPTSAPAPTATPTTSAPAPTVPTTPIVAPAPTAQSGPQTLPETGSADPSRLLAGIVIGLILMLAGMAVWSRARPRPHPRSR